MFCVCLCFDMHYFVSFLVFSIILAGCFAFIVLRMYCYCKCSVALPNGGVSRSALCDCGISWSHSLSFLGNRADPDP